MRVGGWPRAGGPAWSLSRALKTTVMVIGGLALTAYVVLYLVSYVWTRGHPWDTSTVNENPIEAAFTTATCRKLKWDPVKGQWVETKLSPREARMCRTLTTP